MRSRTRVVITLLFDNSSTSQDIEASLGFRDDLSVLMLLEADVLFPYILLLFGFVDGLRIVCCLLKAFCVDETHHFLPTLSC